MILGMPPLTFAHVLISLVGILTGAVVMTGLIKNDPMKGWTLAFLVTTIATSVTGFLFFPFEPALHEMAPKQTEAPFVITQAVVLVAYIVVGVLGVKRFHPAPA